MKKSKATAVASFILGSFFWIPLINIICGTLAIHLGVKALTKIKKYPMKYSGKLFAVTGIILGLLVYATYLTGLGMCLLGFKEVCNNVGLPFLA